MDRTVQAPEIALKRPNGGVDAARDPAHSLHHLGGLGAPVAIDQTSSPPLVVVDLPGQSPELAFLGEPGLEALAETFLELALRGLPIKA